MSQMPPPMPVEPGVPSMSTDFRMLPMPPAWPKVVGIISIVLGSLGVICNVCSLVSGAAGSAFVGMAPPEQQEQMKQQMAASSGVGQMALYAIGVLVGLLLIAAGVFLLQRNTLGRVLHLAYGAIGVLFVLIRAGVGLASIPTVIQNMSSNPQAAQQLAAMKPMMYIMVAGAFCVGIAYPVFCLIWFGIVKRKDSDMTGGIPQEPIV